ncbi:MAG: hypothetical protein PVG07_12615, partial [Acidobacteriota bacterium]
MRTLRCLLSVPALLLLLPVGGCGASGPSPDAIAALGDEEIAYTELAGFVETQTDSSPAALE